MLSQLAVPFLVTYCAAYDPDEKPDWTIRHQPNCTQLGRIPFPIYYDHETAKNRFFPLAAGAWSRVGDDGCARLAFPYAEVNQKTVEASELRRARVLKYQAEVPYYYDSAYVRGCATGARTLARASKF